MSVRPPQIKSRHATGGIFRSLLVLLCLAAVAVAAAGWWWLQQPLPMRADAVDLSIETGSTPREIAQDWVNAVVETSPWLLYQWFRVSGQARDIKAGSYELARGATPRDLLRMMVRGDETLATVRLIEGWTFLRFRQELAQAPALRPTTRQMTDAEIMAALGAPGVAPEGRFFPDTYSYAKGSSDLAVMRRAMQAMQKHLSEAWMSRAADSPLRSEHEALILASIVEKETGMAADRAQIAGVFSNRLRIGMPLQTDPTVIYGIGPSFDGNLRKIHLQTDTPFNTYTRRGLPPTPIAMPGKAALMAAVRPAQTRALYFVARGDGTSAFSQTLAEHNQAVNKYQRKIRTSP